MIWPRWALAALAAGLFAIPSIARAQDQTAKGSLGATIGYPFILSPGELKWGQAPRLMGKGHFQYVINKTWRTSFTFGYGWFGWSDKFNAPFILQAEQVNGDTTKGDQLLIMNPFTAVVHYTHPLSKSWLGFVGVGPGIFRVNIQNDHRTIYDPVTHERFKFGSFGLSGDLGAEYFLPANKNVSLLGMASLDYLFGGASESKYPSGYSGTYIFMDVNIGVNVYFKPPGAKSAPVPVLPPAEEPPPSTPSAAPADTSKTGK